MRLSEVIPFLIIVGAILVGRTLDRRGIAWGGWLSLFAGILLRLWAGLIVAWSAVRAAELGGVWWGALAGVLGAGGLVILAFAGLLVWGLLKYGIDDEN